MPSWKNLILCAFLVGYDGPPGKSLADDPFLRPYVEQLKKTTTADGLRKITAMDRSELILLHHGFGTSIRNRWLRGDRDPALVQFFLAHEIHEPDGMSMVVIEALWIDLNRSLTPEQRAAVEKKRAIVVRKRATYEKLESECEAQLKKAQAEFDRQYARHGLPSQNPESRVPFDRLIVEKSGRVREITFFKGASRELKTQLRKTINTFRFSEFSDDEFVTLYIGEFPRCRVLERNMLHQ